MEKNSSYNSTKKFSIYFECCFVFSFRIYSFVMLLADRRTFVLAEEQGDRKRKRKKSGEKEKNANETWIIFTISKTFKQLRKHLIFPRYSFFGLLDFFLNELMLTNWELHWENADKQFFGQSRRGRLGSKRNRYSHKQLIITKQCKYIKSSFINIITFSRIKYPQRHTTIHVYPIHCRFLFVANIIISI